MTRYTIHDAMQMDQRIMGLASYEVSEGMMRIPSDMDDMSSFQREMMAQFKQFKQMVQRDECSISDIEQMVILRHGPVVNPYAKLTMSEALKKISETPMEESFVENSSSNFVNSFMEALIGRGGRAFFIDEDRNVMDHIIRDDAGETKDKNEEESSRSSEDTEHDKEFGSDDKK